MSQYLAYAVAYEESIRQYALAQSVPSWEFSDWLIEGVISEAPPEWLYAARSVVAMYMLRDKRTLLGGFFQKTLGLRAYCAENNPVEALECQCIICQKSGRNWQNDVWYMLSDKKNDLANYVVVNVPGSATAVIEGLLYPGTWNTRGMWVCDVCVGLLRAVDVASMSLMSVLLDKADEHHTKELLRVAEMHLSLDERLKLRIERDRAKEQKKAVKRAVLREGAAVTMRLVDGKLVEVVGDE